MLHIDIYLFALLVVALLIISYGLLRYVKIIKDYFNQPEDKTGLYDFIHIKDNIINVDHIVCIKQIIDTNDNSCLIIIELDDNKEPIYFRYDEDDWRECSDVFEQISIALDPAQIVTD